MKKILRKILNVFFLTAALMTTLPALAAVGTAGAAASAAIAKTVKGGSTGGDFSLPSIAMNMGGADGKPADLVSVLKIVMLLTFLTLAPAILVMITSFTRVVIVLSFLRQ